jgi:hypothetical protein
MPSLAVAMGLSAAVGVAAPPQAQAGGDELRLCDSHRTSAAARMASDVKVGELARLLHGTWVRRLTIQGVPVQTNSFFYFDMERPAAGRGEALMIDRINQGWDRTSPVPADAASPGPEPEPAATTGAYWSVSIKSGATDPAAPGRSGAMVALAGDYRGTGEEYPRGGFRFTETGSFYRVGNSYATLRPWRAPPQATAAEPPAAMPRTGAAETYSKVDAVILKAPVGGARSRPPTLTFVICQDGIVDRYYKISSLTPRIDGRPLRAAWRSALASGIFEGQRRP